MKTVQQLLDEARAITNEMIRLARVHAPERVQEFERAQQKLEDELATRH